MKKVMISSTSRDLPEHRKQAMDAILRMKLFPLAMEHLTAGTGDAIDVSLAMVDEADVYIGIFARRYGYIPDDPRNPNKLSITEMEYRRAVDRKIPVLIYLMDDDHAIPVIARDAEVYFEPDQDKKAKLAKLKDEITTNRVVAFFTSPQDLGVYLIQSLSTLT